MNKTESLNSDGKKNPKHDHKDQSVSVQDFEGSKPKKKPNKLIAWCKQCIGKKKAKLKKSKEKRKKKKQEKKEKEKEKKPGEKKSFLQKIKTSSCLKGKKKKGKKDDESRDDIKEAGTSMRDVKERLIVDRSDSRISMGERRGSREGKVREKRHKVEKSVSYADSRPSVDKSYTSLPTRDMTKSCCYLCVENSMAIAAAKGPVQPVASDKSMETEVPNMIEKSCSPIKCAVHVRTVKSMIRIKVRDTCTSYGKITEPVKVAKPKKKRKKFRLFPKKKRAECPIRRTVGCVTDDSTQPVGCSKSKEKKEKKEKKKFEPCCQDKAV